MTHSVGPQAGRQPAYEMHAEIPQDEIRSAADDNHIIVECCFKDRLFDKGNKPGK